MSDAKAIEMLHPPLKLSGAIASEGKMVETRLTNVELPLGTIGEVVETEHGFRPHRHGVVVRCTAEHVSDMNRRFRKQRRVPGDTAVEVTNGESNMDDGRRGW